MPNQDSTTATTAAAVHTVKFHKAAHEYRVLDSNGVIVDRFVFDAFDFSDQRRAYRAALAEASARDEEAELVQAEAELEPTPSDVALAQHLIGELNEMEQLGIVGEQLDRYDAKSAQVRALGFEIGPNASGGYVLMNSARTEVIEPVALPAEPIAITDPDQIPAALVAAAWGLVPDHQHAVNTGKQWLMVFEEKPELWRTIWRNLSEDEQDDVLAGARLAGATPDELAALAGLSHGTPIDVAKAA